MKTAPESLQGIFDRTFAITHVLRLLAIVVAFVGVLSALIANYPLGSVTTYDVSAPNSAVVS